jgi:membrane protein DedA with SNARE-associated domain
MNAADFIHHYGYYAVAVGTDLEGELVMAAAGVTAAAGFLTLPGIILAGMAGIFASDTFCFFAGRLAGGWIRRKFPRFHTRLDRALKMIGRHEDRLIVYFQFFPGLCTVTPIAFGMSGISTARFMALDLVGNAVWTLVFSLGGYVFGAAFGQMVRQSLRWEIGAAAIVIMVVAAAWMLSRNLGRRLQSAA